MIRWLHDNRLSHPLIALLIVAPFAAAGIVWVGIALAIGFYWGREKTQHEYRIKGGGSTVTVWHRGWLPMEWGQHQQDFWPVVAVSMLAAFVTMFFDDAAAFVPTNSEVTMDLLTLLTDAWGAAAGTMIVSQGLKLFWATLGILLAWLTSRVLDWLRRRRFREIASSSPELHGYLGLRWMGICLYYAIVMAFACLCLVIVIPPSTGHAATFSNRYDAQIYTAAKRWMPDVPWKLWKAQLYQESRLDPNARSPAGAEGLAQFMPATWAQITRAMGVGAAPRTDAAISIQAGAYYMATLRRQWSSPRPEFDRHNLAMASYNAGIGHILTAQRLCGMPLLYESIMACLPQVTGRHANETLGYAPAIRRWHMLMEAAG